MSNTGGTTKDGGIEAILSTDQALHVTNTGVVADDGSVVKASQIRTEGIEDALEVQGLLHSILREIRLLTEIIKDETGSRMNMGDLDE